MKGDDMLERLLDLAARIGRVVDAIPETRLGRHIAVQLVRCATAGPANYSEGRAAESRGDFIHKLSIVHKELNECEVWLKLIVKAELLSAKKLASVLCDTDQLARIIGRSVITAKANEKRKGPA